VLKILAFQDRHENKDSYDLVYCLLNVGEGPEEAGRIASHSAIRHWFAQVEEALGLLAGRFESVDHDGPQAYGAFLGGGADAEAEARLRQEAVAVVREFLDACQ
jgi:hypothetical protein